MWAVAAGAARRESAPLSVLLSTPRTADACFFQHCADRSVAQAASCALVPPRCHIPVPLTHPSACLIHKGSAGVWCCAAHFTACIAQSSLLLRLSSNQPGAGSGRENIAAAEACRALIVFNHVAYTDGVALVHIFPPSGLANTSVAKIPFVGAILQARAPLLLSCRQSAAESLCPCLYYEFGSPGPQACLARRRMSSPYAGAVLPVCAAEGVERCGAARSRLQQRQQHHRADARARG